MNRSIFVFLMSFFIFSTVTAQNGKIKWINTEAEKVTFVGNYQFAKGNDSYYLLMSENGAFQRKHPLKYIFYPKQRLLIFGT